MKVTSFDNNTNKIIRDPKQDNLFDLFQKNLVYNKNTLFKLYIVPREFEMRLDRISNFLYNSTDYVEELMILNDIISPYSVKEGQYIFYCDIDNLKTLYVTDSMRADINDSKQKLINSQQKNKNEVDKNLSQTIKPSNLEQIRISKDNRIQILNTFE